MTPLDLFAYVFEAKTDKLDKGLKDAEKKTDKLDKGLKEADRTADDLGKAFRDVIIDAAKATAALFTVGALMSASAQAAAYADELGRVSKELRVNAADLDAWQAAAISTGGTAEGLRQSVGSLREMLDELRTTGTSEAAYALQYFGVSLRNASGRLREPLELLPALAARFEKLSAARQFDFAKRLGLDAGTIALLRQGRTAVEDQIARQKQLGTVTERDTEIARRYEQQIEDTRRVFQRLTLDGNQVILPFLTRLYKSFEEGIQWIRENKDLVTGFVLGVAGALTAFYLPAVIGATVATLAWLAPWLLIIGAVAAVGAAVALLYEDFLVFQAGGKSMIGDLAERFPRLAESVKTVAAALGAVWDIFKAVAEFIIGALTGDVSAAFDAFRAKIEGVVSRVLDEFPRVGEAFRAVGKIASAVGESVTAIWDSLLDAIKGVIDFAASAYDTVAGLAKSAGEWVMGGNEPQMAVAAAAPALRMIAAPRAEENRQALIAGRAALAAAGSAPITTTTPGAIQAPAMRSGDRNSTVKVDKIEVQTQATDADGISQAIGSSLEREMRMAVDQFDDGVAS